MKFLLLLFSLCLMQQTTFAQAMNDYDVIEDKETGTPIFKGECTFEALAGEKSFTWFQSRADAYTPDTGIINLMKPHIRNYNIIVLMGTWCSDSHTLVPQLFKVFREVFFPTSQYQMFALDKAKEAKYVEHKLYQVSRVPTIIVRRGPLEVGRIVETVKESIEADLAKIILNDAAKK